MIHGENETCSSFVWEFYAPFFRVISHVITLTRRGNGSVRPEYTGFYKNGTITDYTPAPPPQEINDSDPTDIIPM